MSARLVIQLYDGDDLVHEFSRSTTNVPEGIPLMLGAAMGWMQAYGGAINARQWAADVRRVQQAATALAAEATEEPPG